LSLKKYIQILLVVQFLFSIPVSTSSATELYLKPDKVQAFYSSGDISSSLIEVDLTIEDVTNLQEFFIVFSYDTELLEFIHWKIDDEFYNESSGILGTAFNGVLLRPFNGSSKLFTYYFKVRSLGDTSISLEGSTIRDDMGRLVEIDINTCIIEIDSLGEYLDSYEQEIEVQRNRILELVTENTELESNTTLLQVENSNLRNQVQELEGINSELVREIENSQRIPGYSIHIILVGIIMTYYILIHMNK
jgi:hypothetical protein